MFIPFQKFKIHITKDLSKKWYYRFQLLQNGKWKTYQFVVPKSDAGTKTSRLKWLRNEAHEAEQLLLKGKHPLQLKTIIAEESNVIESLLIANDFRAAQVADRTAEQYGIKLSKFCEWLLKKKYAHLKAADINSVQIQSFLDSLIKSGKSAKTHNNYYFYLKALFKHLLKRGKIISNPFGPLDPMRVRRKKESKYISVQDRKILFDHFRNRCYPLYLYCQFMYYFMTRHQDLFGLQVRDFNLNDWTVYLEASSNKNYKGRYNKIPVVLRPLIEKMQLEKMPKRWYIFSHSLRPGPTRGLQKKISHKFRYYSREVLEDLEKKTHSLYHLKYTAVTDYLKNDANFSDVQKTAGWTHMTMIEIYNQERPIEEDSTLVQNAPPLL